jgi:Kef-type K+ transport system membrane component KefB
MHDSNMQILLAAMAGLFVIIVAARLCGMLATKIGQPSVVGEMVSGVLLGPSVFGALLPDVTVAVFTPDSRPTLYVIAFLGLTFYMFLVGLDHEHHSRNRKESALPVVLGIAGFLGPLMLGAAVAWLLSDQFKPPMVLTGVFALFVGGALSLTAFPMLARVLQERQMMHSAFGGVAIRTAAIDDAIAWCVLAVVGAIVVGGSFWGVAWTVVPAIIFAVAAFALLPRALTPMLQRAVKRGSLSDGTFVVVLGLVLAAGWFTDYIGIYSVFGGFILGMAMPRVNGFNELIKARLLQVVRCFFLPVFFAFSGLNTELGSALDPTFLMAFGLLLVVALSSKLLASLIVLRGFGWRWGESIAMGGLMNARGLMILIFINIGLQLGVIEERLFSILVLIAILTTALALPLYRTHFTAAREAEARRDHQGTAPGLETLPLPTGARGQGATLHGRSRRDSEASDQDHP